MEMENNSNKFKWIVYSVVCTKNKKLYIGYHKTSNPDKFDGYIGGGWEIGTMIKNPSTAYEFALKKYGYDSFIRTTLKVFDTEKEARDFEAYLVDLDFIKRRDTYNTIVGGSGGGKFKKFYQYDLNGNFIKEWDSREQLIQEYNLQNDTNRIHRAVVNKWSAFESFWTAEKVEKLNLDEFRISKFSIIYQVDNNGNVINKFNTAKEAAECLKVSLPFINECISKKIPAKNYFFIKDITTKYDVIKKYQDRVTKLNDNCISIYDGESKKIIETFKNFKDLSKFLNVPTTELKSAIKNNELVSNYLLAYGFNDQYNENSKCGLRINQFDMDGNLVKTWDSISQCTKEHPKVRLVLLGLRTHTHGYIFKFADELKI